jgi:hypothetical protein
MRVRAVMVMLLIAAVVITAAVPAMAQEIPCPERGIGKTVCESVAPLVSFVLQLAGAVIGIMVIIWVIRLIH